MGLPQEVFAEGRQVKQKQEQVDRTTQTEELVAYSDTTDADTLVATSQVTIDDADDNNDSWRSVLHEMDADDVAGMIFALCVLLIIFVLAPLFIIGLLIYFILRNRKQKMKLAEMAIQNGQPIPEQLLEERQDDEEELWRKGMRQTFLGIGLMVFLGYTAGTVGFGIGALVTAIGVGKLAIVKTSKKKRNPRSGSFSDACDEEINAFRGEEKNDARDGEEV